MNILYVMIPLSLVLVVFAGWAFFWAVGSGQFDDLESPAWDVLREPSSAPDADANALADAQVEAQAKPDAQANALADAEAQADAQVEASNVSLDVMAAAPSAGEPRAEMSAAPPRNVPGRSAAGVRRTARSG